MGHSWTTANLILVQGEPFPCGHENSEANTFALSRGRKKCRTCVFGRGIVDVEVRVADPERWQAAQAAISGCRMVGCGCTTDSHWRPYAVRKKRKHGAIVNEADHKAILAEFGMVCHICGQDIASPGDLHFDHVISLTKEGPHSAENLRPSHALCNMRKGTKSLEDFLAQNRVA